MIPLLLLAQSEPPVGFSSFWENAMYIIVSLAAIVGLWKMVRPGSSTTVIASQPLKMEEAERFVEEARYEREREELRDELGRQARNRKDRYILEEQREQARAAAIADLKARSDAQGEAIRQLSGEVGEMQGRIDAIPQRTIELLKGTKGLLD